MSSSPLFFPHFYPNTKNQMDDVTKMVDSYVRHYFNNFDRDRALLLKEFDKDSEFSCEGKTYNDPSSILGALLALPHKNVYHKITSIDFDFLSEISCVVYVCGKQIHSGVVDSGLHFSQVFLPTPHRF
ncbi:putative nuclear transport factor 2, NTF2-like domain superfamily [Helianthus anomalus]